MCAIEVPIINDGRESEHNYNRKFNQKKSKKLPKSLKTSLTYRNDFDKTKKELQLGKPKDTRQNMHDDI